uniref:Uncharacterized protein n=1 Tax=Chromera velia CCMP2878 TaxID=1169474 RepID=A0A0G4HJQ9_9ALVE|eukprot:Cvel_7121.t1-p1 / transcript=Cvel_7121.t1 / gene=Cvel_7121 / organism=Chromera_velia_CCMP2878 / gene_product=hypothetical protein / transcript_product=hypothetical protein / location=Cvel_scaffold365:51721-53018(-) / protein_length=379 / sequence_SO=supercontig / SO=protein_coding / is_pseudo=false
MDTFARLFGFEESRDYQQNQSRLQSLLKETKDERGIMASFSVGASSVQAGRFYVKALSALRASVGSARTVSSNRPQVVLKNIVGEARSMHSKPEYEGAVFQAASQFNCLEFASPYATPELGITVYEHDRTQGPACALACMAGTAYRNYLVKMPDRRVGQTRDNQLNCLQKAMQSLSLHMPNQKAAQALPPDSKCNVHVRNGYVDSDERALSELNEILRNERTREEAKALVEVGVQEETDVTDLFNSGGSGGAPQRSVTQVYCSALSVGYSHVSADLWEPLARMILESIYESTLLIGIETNMRRKELGLPARPVLLTKVGGGVFGNRAEWIKNAIRKACENVWRLLPELGPSGERRLEVLVVHFREVERGWAELDRVFFD